MIDLPALYAECAPAVHPVTMGAIVHVESGGNPLALHVNGLPDRLQPHPATLDEAARTAEAWIARGASIDIGLGQVNNHNLSALGLTVREALAPCTNLRAAAQILAADYLGAARLVGEGQGALRMSLSAYNTGTYTRGFTNGYVARYLGGYTVPPLAGPPPAALTMRAVAIVHAAPMNPLTADTTVSWGPGGDD